MADDAIARLEAAALKAREFTHQIGERSYTLRVPTRTEVQETAHRRGLLQDGYSSVVPKLLNTYLLRAAVVGWTGVRERDVLPGGEGAPLPWSPRAVALLLEARTVDADALGQALDERIAQRDAAIEADAKNSPPASSSPEAATARANSD